MRFWYQIEGNIQVADIPSAVALMPVSAFDLHVFAEEDGSWFYVVMGEAEIFPPMTLEGWLAPLFAAGTVHGTSWHQFGSPMTEAWLADHGVDPAAALKAVERRREGQPAQIAEVVEREAVLRLVGYARDATCLPGLTPRLADHAFADLLERLREMPAACPRQPVGPGMPEPR